MMKQFLLNKIKRFFNPTFLGISVEGGRLHFALVVKERGGPCIKHTKTLASLDNAILNQILGTFSAFTPRLVTGLQTQDVVFRTLTLPLKGKRRVLAALPFQLEALLPFSAQEAVVHLLKSSSGNFSVIATSETLLKQHLDVFHALHITPDVVTSTPLALFRLAQFIYPKRKEILLFYFGEERTSCILIQDGHIALSQSIPFGKTDCLQLLKTAPAEKKTIDALLSAQEHPSADALKQTLQNELERLLFFLKEKSDFSLDISCALFGEKVFTQELRSLWAKIFPSLLPAEDVETLAPGFALDALAADSKSQQLLQGEFAPAHHLRLRKKRTLFFSMACLLLSALFALSSSLLLHKQTKTLSEKYLRCFFLKENRSLSLSEIEDALSKVQQGLGKQKNSYPFFLPLPNVSEVLAWLSMQPSLITDKGVAKEGVEFKSMRYQLIKFPTLEDPSIPYQGQVELEFTATTPRLAREFHEMLLKGDRIVNAKKEIKWHAQGNRYTVQFDLNKKPNL